jgi:hypothetical protein
MLYRAGRGVRRALVETAGINGDLVAGCLADALLVAVVVERDRRAALAWSRSADPSFSFTYLS